MGSNVGFYCGLSDTTALQNFAASLGLELVAPIITKEVAVSPEEGPYCYLSLVAKSELHPYGESLIKITPAKDPLLAFMRSYFSNPYLVAGHIHWSDDVVVLGVQTKPYFQKLRNWIKKEWERLPGGDYYIGPEAQELLAKGAQMVNVLPEQASFKVIKI